MSMGSQVEFFKKPFFWFSTGVFFWFFGFFGRDFYFLFFIFGFIFFYINYIRNKNKLDDFFQKITPNKILLLWISYSIVTVIHQFLKFYSFKWNVLDVGSYSNAIYNGSYFLNFNSFLQIPALADHFIPSLYLFSPLYLIYPSVHWITIAKTFSSLITPILVYFWIRDKIENKNEKLWICFFFGTTLLLIYEPSINSYNFEFSPSSLALPICILILIFYEKKQWIFFAISCLFLLGLKEHTGVVLVGIGLHYFFKNKSFFGILFSLFGFIFSYLIVYQVLPYFRDYQFFYNTYTDPLKDLDLKLNYLVNLLIPLLFIPVIFWKNGIIAFPIIGINLISGKPSMYSSQYHHDDIASLLLILSCVLTYIDLRNKKIIINDKHYLKYFFLFFLIYQSITIKNSSPIKSLINDFPNAYHRNIIDEIEDIKKISTGYSTAVQNAIGPHFHQRDSVLMSSGKNNDCNPPLISGKLVDFIILHRELDSHMISDIDLCIKHLENNNKYQKISKYQSLAVFRRN